MSWPTKFDSSPTVCLQKQRKLIDQPKARKQQKSVECEEKLITYDELVHQSWAQSDERFVGKCTIISRPTRDQETTENQWRVTRCQSALDRPIMSWPTKSQPNPTSGLSANARKLLDKSEARKQRKFSGTWPNVNRVWGHNAFAHQISA